MPPPGNNRTPASEVHTSFEPVEALLFDEIETELTEAGTCSIVAEPGADDHIHEAIGVARPIAVAMLGAQVRHSQQDMAPQIRVKEVSRRRELREDFHRGSPVWIAHERQVEKRFDRSTVKLRAQVRIFFVALFVCGVQRPADAGLAQVVEADLLRAARTIVRCVKSCSY